MRVPSDLLAAEGLRSLLQDYAGVLQAEGAFAGLGWEDAKQIAAAVAIDSWRCTPKPW